jgi:hypothetical protein
MTSQGGIRFLSDWGLRITPPVEFNDPFEFRPYMGKPLTGEYSNEIVHTETPKIIASEFSAVFQLNSGENLTPGEVSDIENCLMTPLDFNLKKRVVKNLSKKIPNFNRKNFDLCLVKIRSMQPELIQIAYDYASTLINQANSIANDVVTDSLPITLGVLCLSQNENQPLMWAHYADSHKGIMIEFDTENPTFNRKRTAFDELGRFRSVSYSKSRPAMNLETIFKNNSFEEFALTKAEQWSYEEEIRLIWPLESADTKVPTSAGLVCLLSCPSSSVLSVTLGCKASEQTLNSVRQALQNQLGTEHISIRRSQLDASDFKLNYFSV